MKDQEKIAVIQAQIDGKELQFRVLRGSSGYIKNTEIFGTSWHNCDHPSKGNAGPFKFNFVDYEYRVRPSTTKIKLNDQYTAEVGPEETTVGCQTFKNEAILKVAEAIKEGGQWVTPEIGEAITSGFQFRLSESDEWSPTIYRLGQIKVTKETQHYYRRPR